MANYKAISTGNWSNIAIWQTWDGSAWVAASVLPSSSDDVWANNFTVTIDQDITVLTLRNAANASPVVTAGGQFKIETDNITVTCINEIIGTYLYQNASALNLIGTSGSGLIINLNMSIRTLLTTSTNLKFIQIGHTGTLNYVGTITGAVSTISMITFTTPIVMNMVGDIVFYNNVASPTLNLNVNNTILNLVGDVYCSSSSSQPGYCIVISSTSTVNITGNVYVNGSATTNSYIAIAISAGGTLNITGNITGGTYGTTQYAISSNAASYIKHIGVLQGGTASNLSTGAAGIVTTNNSSITILSGPFIFGNYGAPPFNCVRVFFSNNVSKYIEFASDSTDGALFPAGAPTRLTMYSPNIIADAPIPTDVRQGTVYALGSQTGTLIVPDPSNVRKDVPTDDTVGTADLSAADMWDYLTSNISTSGSIGEAILDIKTKTDTIPTNPASVDAVGAIVASYNV